MKRHDDDCEVRLHPVGSSERSYPRQIELVIDSGQIVLMSSELTAGNALSQDEPYAVLDRANRLAGDSTVSVVTNLDGYAVIVIINPPHGDNAYQILLADEVDPSIFIDVS